MSAPGNADHSNADLVTIDSYEEESHDHSDDRARISAPLSPVQSDLLTPATLSPPIESTETSPLLDSSSYGASYASTSTPVVCCRPGGRPADIPPPTNNNNAHIFPSGPPQDMGGQPLWYRSYALREFERNKPFQSRRPVKERGICGSKYLHRWLLALGLLAILFLIQCLIQDAVHTEPSTHHWDPFDRSLPYWSKTYTRSFHMLESFSVLDEIRAPFPVNGRVKIEPAQSGQEEDIVATIAFGSSKEFQVSLPNWEFEDSSLHLQLPTFSKDPDFTSSSYGTYLSVAVTLYLNPDVAWTSFNIDTTHLAIESSSQLFSSKDSTLEPTINTTSFKTHSTPIHLSHWTARRTILKTSSSPITGAFTLLDLLDLTSSSGSIKVSVDSGEADSSNPQPAQLSVSTSSGSVHVDSDLTTVYAREYKTDVSTQSASISGTYLLGTSARFTSSSGTIDPDIMPYDSQASSALHTRSSSGGTRVQVRSAYKDGGKAFKDLRSEHVSSGSGGVEVRYPREWEGKIDAATGSGSISVRGEGVVVDEAGKYGGGHVRAHKGEGESRIEARAGSGSVRIGVGNV
ncbi:hypothetical protein MBLNU13_g01354t1 [Cladosporium sp. NU13]